MDGAGGGGGDGGSGGGTGGHRVLCRLRATTVVYGSNDGSSSSSGTEGATVSAADDAVSAQDLLERIMELVQHSPLKVGYRIPPSESNLIRF